MKVIVDNVLRIINGAKNKKLMKYCKENLSIKNPEYLQNQRLGFSVYRIPKMLYWYETRDNDLILPFGCLKHIYTMFPSPTDYLIKYKNIKPIKYKSNIKLYDYQEQAKNKAFSAKNGVIVMPARERKNTNSITIN